jgi:hypothetical protein
MFSKATSSPSDLLGTTTEKDIDYIITFSKMSENQLRAALSSTPLDVISEVEKSIVDFMTFPEQIHHFFRTSIGYPSDEATTKGIHAYADGTVRKMGQELDDSISKFLYVQQTLSTELGRTPPSEPSTMSVKEKKAREASYDSLEYLARTYIKVSAAQAQLAKTHATLTQILNEAAATKQRRSCW